LPDVPPVQFSYQAPTAPKKSSANDGARLADGGRPGGVECCGCCCYEQQHVCSTFRVRRYCGVVGVYMWVCGWVCYNLDEKAK
jgi:hypothetical protein